MTLRFTKMHGAGNDFVIVDCRRRPLALDARRIARLGDRHFGVGFDQMLTIESSPDPSCSFAYAIYNQDGLTAKQCGNGVRCVAAWLHRDGAIGLGATRLSSPSGPIDIDVLDAGHVRAGMGMPRFAPEQIPLQLAPADPYRLHLNDAEIEFGAVSMGNPHAVIEVDDVTTAPLSTLGAALSTHPLFAQGANVGFVELVDRGHLRLRVWERGAGATLACGTGACAAVAVLRRRGKVDAKVAVDLPGGMLQIAWHGEGQPLTMTGAAEFVFEGEHDA